MGTRNFKDIFSQRPCGHLVVVHDHLEGANRPINLKTFTKVSWLSNNAYKGEFKMMCLHLDNRFLAKDLFSMYCSKN